MDISLHGMNGTYNDEITTSPELAALITSAQAWHYHIIPYELNGNVLVVLSASILPNDEVVKVLELLLNRSVQVMSASPDAVMKALQRYYRKSISTPSKPTETLSGDKEFIHKLISDAKSIGSSDIHIEIYDERARIRMRIDGLLVERYVLAKMEYQAMINKVKILANLDIAEKRLPQDGRIIFQDEDRKFDIRVSVLPTLYGEKVVMRLLSNDASNIYIENLGFSTSELTAYLDGIKRTHGIVLISGPTGSGKTTTLYATLKVLNEEKRNIVTIEDPIEYTLDGINQVQLKESIGLTFSSALRTFLRQDPDVIMLGEIRDAETAQMAIRASLTGHLVLSTIHTNSAWGTISRLMDMGVAPFLLANTLNTSVAQRLIRKLCNTCKVRVKYSGGLPEDFNPPLPLEWIFEPRGCEECHHTGYRGRKALYEVLSIDGHLSEAIKLQKSSIKDWMESKKIRTLAQNAFLLLYEGVSSLEETYPLLRND